MKHQAIISGRLKDWNEAGECGLEGKFNREFPLWFIKPLICGIVVKFRIWLKNYIECCYRCIRWSDGILGLAKYGINFKVSC